MGKERNKGKKEGREEGEHGGTERGKGVGGRKENERKGVGNGSDGSG